MYITEGIDEGTQEINAELGAQCDAAEELTNIGDLPELDGEISDTEETERQGRSLLDDLADPDLFEDNEPGEYTYTETELGKSASGVLELADDPERDSVAQRSAGGEFRKPDDDGGHLIGARFGGSPSTENLEAQNRQLNRGEFKAVENELARSIEAGDKVFVDVESFRPTGSERPSAFMGYAITEHEDGTRDSQSFTFPNTSRQEQEDLRLLFGNKELTEEDKHAAELEAEYTDGADYAESDVEPEA